MSPDSIPKKQINLEPGFFRRSNPRVDFHLPANGKISQDDEIPDERVVPPSPKNIIFSDTHSIMSQTHDDRKNDEMMKTQVVKSKYEKFFNHQDKRSNK